MLLSPQQHLPADYQILFLFSQEEIASLLDLNLPSLQKEANQEWFLQFLDSKNQAVMVIFNEFPLLRLIV